MFSVVVVFYTKADRWELQIHPLYVLFAVCIVFVVVIYREANL